MVGWDVEAVSVEEVGGVEACARAPWLCSSRPVVSMWCMGPHMGMPLASCSLTIKSSSLHMSGTEVLALRPVNWG